MVRIRVALFWGPADCPPVRASCAGGTMQCADSILPDSHRSRVFHRRKPAGHPASSRRRSFPRDDLTSPRGPSDFLRGRTLPTTFSVFSPLTYLNNCEYSIDSYYSYLMSRTALIILGVGFLVLIGIGATVWFLGQNQDIRSRASETPSPIPTLFTPITPTIAAEVQNDACPAPAPVASVTVEYPGCDAQENCNFTQASCTWEPTDASSYNYTVTEVESGTVIVNNASVPSDTASVVFPVTQGKTYKCDVTVASSCGTLSSIVSDQLLCVADALIEPTPTTVVPPTPTPTTVAAVPTTPPATPTIEAPGGLMDGMFVFGGVAVLLIGGVLLFVL